MESFKLILKEEISIINLFIKHEILPHIVDIIDPTIMWKTIKSLFEQKSNGQHLVLKTKLTNLWSEEGASIVDYFKQLKYLTNQLVNIEKQIWHKIYLILFSTSQKMFLWIFCGESFFWEQSISCKKNRNTLFSFHMICIFEA